MRPDGNTIAYCGRAGRGPTVVFLGGFRSDMTGTKAMALDDWARKAGRAYLRFDYLGHGQSSGRFEDGTIGRWLDDSLAAIDRLTSGQLVLVGSSMGGWLSLLVALARRERIAGLVLIAEWLLGHLPLSLFQLNALGLMISTSLGEFLLTVWIRFVLNRRTIAIDAA